jgi:peptide/nickel transport system substrate-binding protein
MRLEEFVAKGGALSYGSYPDIEGLIQGQASQLGCRERESMLHRIQQLVYERTIYASLWQHAFMSGVGARVGESGLVLIASHPYSAPYEGATLAAK